MQEKLAADLQKLLPAADTLDGFSTLAAKLLAQGWNNTPVMEPVGYVATWMTDEPSVMRANTHVWPSVEKAEQDMKQWLDPSGYTLYALVPITPAS